MAMLRDLAASGGRVGESVNSVSPGYLFVIGISFLDLVSCHLSKLSWIPSVPVKITALPKNFSQ